jgi:hypothetical protein
MTFGVSGIGRRGYRLVRRRRLLTVLAALRVLRRLGVGRVVWSFTPRRLKLAAAGLAVGTLLLLAGAVAAVVILVLHVT